MGVSLSLALFLCLSFSVSVSLSLFFCLSFSVSLSLFHPSRRTFLFPFQLPNGKYRTVIVNIINNTLTYFTTEHWMLRNERLQAKTIMHAINEVMQKKKNWSSHKSMWK